MWTWLRTLSARALALVRGSALDRALDAEMREHLNLLEQRFRDRGMSDDEARRAARQAFGNVDHMREAHREARAFVAVGRTVQDMGYAVRLLRRDPGFAAVCVLTLALGIGANTAVFTVINGLLLRPAPYPDAAQLLRVGWDWNGTGQVTPAISSLKFEYLKRHGRAFERLTTWDTDTLDFGRRGEGGLLHALRVSDEFFDVIGFQPSIGRSFAAEEQAPGGPPVAILSDLLWRTRFGTDPAIVGRRMTLNDRDYSIVGVMPAAFEFAEEPSRVDVILPLQFELDARSLGANSPALGRLRPGISRDAAMSDINRVMDRLRVDQPAQFTEPTERARLVEIGTLDLRGFQHSLWLLLGTAGLVLIVACANVAGLVLARTTGRARELALRAALGATRGRIVRQVTTESLVLGLTGGLAGLVVGLLGVRMLVGMAPAGVPRLDWIQVDGRVLAFTAALAVLTGIVFGLAAAIPSTGPRLAGYLKDGLRGSGVGPRRARLRSLFVGGEVSLTLVVLAVAGLLTSSLIQLYRTDLGFNPTGVLTMSFRRIPEAYQSPAHSAEIERQLRVRLGAVAGVQAVASTTVAPLGPRGLNAPMTVEGRPDASEGAVEWRHVSPNYFDLLGLPLNRGRGFTDDDVVANHPVVVVSEGFAKRYWPKGDAIGQRIRLGVFRGRFSTEQSTLDPTRRIAPTPREIIGVVADTRELGPAIAPRRTVFLPNAGRAGLPVFLVRGDGRISVETLGAVVHAVDPTLPVPLVATLGERFGNRVAETRFIAVLLAAFAGMALTLAAVGVYGLVSWTMRSQTVEIGIRMALGADRRLVVGRAVAAGMLPVVIGLVVGGAAAIWTRSLASLLRGVAPADPVTVAAAAVALAAVALLAAWLPARRAAGIDPATALRSE